MGRLCYPTKYRPRPVNFSQKSITVQGGDGALFAIRVQSLLALRVSRYKFDRSQKTITVQNVC
jgi:hypothetical protein